MPQAMPSSSRSTRWRCGRGQAGRSRLQAVARRCRGRAPARIGATGRARATDDRLEERGAGSRAASSSSSTATSAFSPTAPGLTMTTMDVVSHLGGAPGELPRDRRRGLHQGRARAGSRAGQPARQSLVVNFCGAFARTDVMAEGIVKAWQKLKPTVPVFFCIHGTGDDRGVAPGARRGLASSRSI